MESDWKPSETESLIVTEEEVGVRLDLFLARRFPTYSRSYFHTLIEKNLVLVNGILVKKRTQLEIGDEIEVEFSFPAEVSVAPENIPLEILYEDDEIIAINKPPGMVVHPAVGNWSGTFVNALLFYCHHLPSSPSLRPGIVHRLDKETSGVLLAAKTEQTQRRLVEAFAQRRIKKEYLAICLGNPGTRTIETLIGRHPKKRQEMAVVETGGKEAKTVCFTLAHHRELSIVKLYPYTGRTHQLRVHMQWIGAPILGDRVYGSTSANQKWKIGRQLLHAYKLTFLHPITQIEIELKAPIPQDIGTLIHIIDKDALSNSES